ncbi:MAG: hypothetical protein ACOVP4_07825 [Bacteriovoracaceae bacterium]
MKFFGRTLSMILSFQLLWSCNGQYTIEGMKVNSGTENVIELNGSIAKAFHHFSNMIIPSAMAQDGEMVVYDMTDPNDPLQIHSEEITGNTYSIKIEKDKVINRIIKLSYESYDDDSKSRDLLIEPTEETKIVTSNLNEEGTLKSRLAEKVVQIELDSESISLQESKYRLKEVKKDSIDDVLDIIGDKEIVYHLLTSRKELAVTVSKYAAYYRWGINNKNSDAIKKAQEAIRQIAIDEGLLKEEKPEEELKNYFEEINYMDLVKFEEVANLEDAYQKLSETVDKTIKVMSDAMINDGVKEGSDHWNEMIDAAKKHYEKRRLEAEEFYTTKVENKYLAQVSYLDEVDFDELKDYQEGYNLLKIAAQKSHEYLNDLMAKDKITEKDSQWQETMKELDVLFQNRVNELEEYFGTPKEPKLEEMTMAKK